MKTVRDAFAILASVVLPGYLHAIWRLLQSDADYPLRGSLIKARFSWGVEKGEYIRNSRQAKRERGIWQRRYWEHQIRNEIDLAWHLDYIHYHPVKHGWATHPVDWPYQHCMLTLSQEWQLRIWGANR